MAELGAQQRELVFCHACENEWAREQNGLQCPGCHSDVVEIIDEHHDPRDNHIVIPDDSDDDDDVSRISNNASNDSLPRHLLHHHNPWQSGHLDSDEPDIEHVEWNPAPGVHFARTSYRSSTPSRRPINPNEAFGPIFQSFSTMFEGAANRPGRPTGTSREGRPRASPRTHFPNHIHRPEFASQNPFPDHHHHHMHHHHHGPWVPGGPPGGRNVFTATGRWPSDAAPPSPNNREGSSMHGVLATLLQSLQTVDQGNGNGNGNGPQNGMAPMQAFLSSILGNGTHGDAVYTDEALDRIITQMMDQTNANSAPGPASAAAIAALPKQKADKSMMGQDSKAECSVCMDAVEIGDEVTILPCKHWFHGDCVGAWLKEHDTCPHCRQGIMPKDVPETASTPRSPGQEPRNNQNLFHNPFIAHGSPPQSQSSQQGSTPTPFTQPGMQQPYMPGGFQDYPEPRSFVIASGQQQGQSPHAPSSQPQHSNRDTSHGSRRRSSVRDRGSGHSGEGGSTGQGVTGWLRSHLRGGSSSGDR